ncbi:MAG: hypothetical protein IBJ15_04270 [Alphaproteobacteria bacterium]|nr:hypothetical protein [Alphaproteobacteria bacterium]
MLPINLDAAKLPIALVGDGKRAARRLELLVEAGALRVSRVPPDGDFSGYRIVYIADFDEDRSREIAARARAAGALVNVEDVTELCDFHTPALIRRGDLTVTVATGGRAPGLAGALAAYLGKMFGAAGRSASACWKPSAAIGARRAWTIARSAKRPRANWIRRAGCRPCRRPPPSPQTPRLRI